MGNQDLGLLTQHRQAEAGDLTVIDAKAEENISLAKTGQKVFGQKVPDSTGSPGLPKKAEPLNFAGAGPGDDKAKIFGTLNPPAKAKEDPKAAQRRNLAANIFGGNDNVSLFNTKAKPSTTAKAFVPTKTTAPGPQPTAQKPATNTGQNLFGVPSKPVQPKSSTSAKKPQPTPSAPADLLAMDDLLGGGDLLGGPPTTNSQPKPAAVAQPSNGGFDIFDMDFNDTPPTTNQTNSNTGGDILGLGQPLPNFSKPAQPKSPHSQRINDIGTDIFGSENIVGAPAPRKLMPFVITTEQFEEYWGDFAEDAIEHSKKTSNVRNQKEFAAMCQSVGFAISETIENDNICSAKYGEEIILFYGTYKLSGQVDCQVKGRIPEEGRLALNKLMAYMK